MWSLATVECPDPAAFRAGASRLNFQHIRMFKPQEMSNAVWALATAGFVPKYIDVFDTTLVPDNLRPSMSDIRKDEITECYAAVAGELMRRTHEFKDQELKGEIPGANILLYFFVDLSNCDLLIRHSLGIFKGEPSVS